MGDGTVRAANGDRIRESFRERMGPKTSQEMDILVSTKGTVGRVAIVPRGFPEHVYSPQLCFFRVLNDDVVDRRWLYHWCRSSQFQRQVAMYSGQTDMAPYLSLRDIASITIDIPAIDEQQRIAGVFGPLDDLIEVDRDLIRDLDNAFMSSWEMLAAECSDTEPLGAHTVVSKGLSYKGAYLVDDGLPMINMGSFGLDGTYRYSGLKKYVETEVKDRHLLNMGDLVVVNTDLTQARDILARPVLNPHKRATSTHHTFQVRVPGGEATRMWIYGALRQESTRQRLISHATGTTVAALPLDSLTQQQIPWIDESSMSRWWAAAAPLVRGHLDLIDEISQLESARDELLPLLMSGRVRVKDVAA